MEKWTTTIGRLGGLLGALAGTGCGWLVTDNGADEPMSDDTEPPPVDEEPPVYPTEAPFTGECFPAAWDEPVDPAEFGAPTTFSLTGSNIRIRGKDTAYVQSIEGPGTLAVAGGGTPLVAFDEAVVDDAILGTLVVVGGSVQLGEGRITVDAETIVSVQGLAYAILPTAMDDDGARPSLPEDAPPEHSAALADTFRFDTPVEALQLLGYEEAYVITPDGARVDLTGPVHVSAPRLYAGWGTGVAATVTAQWSGAVTIGLDPTAGEIADASGPLPGVPAVLLTYDPTLQISTDTIATAADTRARVALDGAGALLPSSVALRLCEPDEIVMPVGSTRILTLAYRQDGPATDAVFSALYVDVDGEPAAWSGRVDARSSLPSQLVEAAEANPDTTWGRGLGDFFEAWGAATQAIAEGLTCVFTFGFVCPDHGSGTAPAVDTLAPYPGWMSPRSRGTFELELTAPFEPGTYAVQLHLAGDNYDAIADLSVVVYE